MCQCQACAAGEALNRGLASLAVRSLLSLSPFCPSSSVRLETAINTNSEFQLSADILAHLKPRFPPRWYFFFSSPAALLRCLSTLKWIHPVWTSEGGVIRLAPLSPLTLSQHFKAVGGWRFESCSQNSFCVGLSLFCQLSDSLPINLLHS